MDKTDLHNVIKQLELNNFEVFLTENIQSARNVFENEILKGIKYSSVSYADSITMHKTGILDLLRNIDSLEFIDTFNHDDSWKEQIDKRKKALTADLFVTGTNALTEKGQLVNLDMIGNRVAPLAFGPRHVVLFIGTNKIVKNLDEAFNRIRTISAPLNAKRHDDLKTPCQKTGICYDCKSPQRICNTWTITEKSYPKNRIKIILIDQDLGY
ncbi:lactate utilization protein [Ancylomarina euxinus]|uniref:Lactate utilization protein n=1 Tax=Ancylomarina euxinus TaxID=2283627 RepID=A0A425XZX9_9BACT|nr:lactate utilization protein [Ancylomarina euxinus]MCZ4695349.1 lactate utilization protein [Ancylomarina euxinus]MUP15545.1 lactate utilization protein [Ancylomarina euxinus]RRG21011.1 lactate utilization protein [Ancylomarina euxinus]